MKLFAIQAYGNYGGGVVVVRAETKERAIELASKINDSTWHTRYHKPTEVVELPAGAEDQILYHYETGE